MSLNLLKGATISVYTSYPWSLPLTYGHYGNRTLTSSGHRSLIRLRARE